MLDDYELFQLRGRVIELEAQVKFLFNHLGITYAPETVPASDDPRIVEQLRKGRLIDAIKIYRELYNSNLVTAKKAVEEIKARLRL